MQVTEIEMVFLVLMKSYLFVYVLWQRKLDTENRISFWARIQFISIKFTCWKPKTISSSTQNAVFKWKLCDDVYSQLAKAWYDFYTHKDWNLSLFLCWVRFLAVRRILWRKMATHTAENWLKITSFSLCSMKTAFSHIKYTQSSTFVLCENGKKDSQSAF